MFTELVERRVVKIMLCYWARVPERWVELSVRDIGRIKANSRKQIETLVVKTPTELFSKINEFDVFYVAGGDAEPLEPYYSQLTGLKEALSGKIFIGSSMGAFLAAESYVLSLDSQDDQVVHKGVGLLPIQVLCHFDKEEKKEHKLSLLRNYSNNPILVLDEFETVRIES
jgi:peptidase E